MLHQKFVAVIYTLAVMLLHLSLAEPIKDNNVALQSTNDFAKCLDSDSISCLQFTLYRKAKSFFENPQIEIVGGVSLTKSQQDREGKSVDKSAIAFETAPTVEARSAEMGNYLMDNLKRFFSERSLNLNFANAARSLSRAIPDDIKADIRELVVESRSKKKKLLKKLMPLLLGVGAKVGVLTVGALFGLLFLAKKALIVSVIAFVLALLSGARGGLGHLGGGGSGGLLGGLGGLFGGKSSGQASSVSGWSTSNGGWSSGGGSGWDTHGSYSSPVAQSIAYSGYKQARR